LNLLYFFQIVLLAQGRRTKGRRTTEVKGIFMWDRLSNIFVTCKNFGILNLFFGMCIVEYEFSATRKVDPTCCVDDILRFEVYEVNYGYISRNIHVTGTMSI
jgi:hypothetical protein